MYSIVFKFFQDNIDSISTGFKKCTKLKYNTLCKKVNGELRFSLDEAIRLQEEFFPDVTVNELFRHE